MFDLNYLDVKMLDLFSMIQQSPNNLELLNALFKSHVAISEF